MRCYVYPEKYREFAMSILKLRYLLLVCFVIGPVLFCMADVVNNDGLLALGAILFVVGCGFFATFSVQDTLAMIKIDETGIHKLDSKGKPYRGSEYQYVRNMEVRAVCITEISSENTKRSYSPVGGNNVKLILVYVDGVNCFDDLQLENVGSKDHPTYYCDRLLHHHSCFAFEYNEKAWELLQAKVSAG